MNDKLELLKRKQIGRYKVDACKNLLAELGFKNPELIDLERSDIILNKITTVFSTLSSVNEMIPGDSISFIESDLIREVYINLKNTSLSYVFNDDFKVCGLFLVNAKLALEQVLNIAKKDEGNTCFILDHNFSYYLRVNFYDESHSNNPNSYDIQRIITSQLS
jgi:hypothetical protein